MNKLIKDHKWLILILVIASVLMISNLGDRLLAGNDEDTTLVVAQNILQYGYPSAIYEGNLIHPDPATHSLIFGKEVWTWGTWLQDYIAAGSLAVFGNDPFFIRLPFVLFGLATIILSYLLSIKITGNKRTAILTALLLTLSTTFLLYSRQARWYSLVMFFTAAALYTYLSLEKGNKKSIILFSISAILLFHSNQILFFGIMAGLTVHALIFNRQFVKELGFSYLSIFIFTFPWFYLAGQFNKLGQAQTSVMALFANFGLNLYYLFVIILPILFLPVLLYIYRKSSGKIKKNYLFISIIATVYVIFLSFLSFNQDLRPALRYLVPLLPLASILNAATILKISEYKKWIGTAVLLLFIATNLVFIAPILPFKGIIGDVAAKYSSEDVGASFAQKTLSPKSYLADYLYETTHKYESPIGDLISTLQQKASPSDTFITNSDFLAIQAYTDLMPAVDMYALRNELDQNQQKSKVLEGKRADWIIVREHPTKEAFLKLINSSLDMSKYKKISIHNNDYYWSEDPSPINHRFRTDLNGEIIIYQRSS